jgi:hypothetical protein
MSNALIQALDAAIEAGGAKQIGVLLLSAGKNPAARAKLVSLLADHAPPTPPPDPQPTPVRTHADPTAPARFAAFRQRRARGEVVVPVVVGPTAIAALQRKGLLNGKHDRATLATAIEELCSNG